MPVIAARDDVMVPRRYARRFLFRFLLILLVLIVRKLVRYFREHEAMADDDYRQRIRRKALHLYRSDGPCCSPAKESSF